MFRELSKCIFLVIVGTLVAVSVVLLPAQAEDGVLLKYDYQKGTSFDHKVKFTQEISFGSFAFSQFMDLEVTEKCMGVTEDGKYQMEMVFNKVESSRMQFDKMVEDNSSETLVGQAVSYLLDEHGEVDKVNAMGYIENWEMISGNIIALIESWYPYLPAEKVASGGNWEEVKDKEDDGEGLLITTNAVFSFEGTKKEKDRECVKITADISQKFEGINSTPMGDFNTDGEGKGEYEVLFDPSDSAIVKLKGKHEVKMDMTPESGKGDDVETTVNMEMERELLK